MRRMQDALCPACGAVFRTRAHSVDCVEAPIDPRYLEIALALSKERVNQQIEELKEENNERQSNTRVT